MIRKTKQKYQSMEDWLMLVKKHGYKMPQLRIISYLEIIMMSRNITWF